MIKLIFFKGETCPGISEWVLNPITSDLLEECKGSSETDTQKLETGTDPGLMQPRATEAAVVRTGRGKGWIFPRRESGPVIS